MLQLEHCVVLNSCNKMVVYFNTSYLASSSVDPLPSSDMNRDPFPYVIPTPCFLHLTCTSRYTPPDTSRYPLLASCTSRYQNHEETPKTDCCVSSQRSTLFHTSSACLPLACYVVNYTAVILYFSGYRRSLRSSSTVPSVSTLH